MLIGVPKEIKNHEYRVGMTPAAIGEARLHGHKPLVEKNAGIGIGASDDDYRRAGAAIAKNAAEVYDRAELIVKVKEPLAEERRRLGRGQTLFTYLHLAADRAQTRDLIKSGAVCIAYETVTDSIGGLPLLAPMSQVAGRLSAQAAAFCLQKTIGGCGKLIGGVPGVAPAKILVLGGGMVGRNAARIAVGMGGDVTVMEKSPATMDRLNAEFNGQVKTAHSNSATIEEYARAADVVIGGVLIPGAAAPKLISEEIVKAMRLGAVIVDVAIDQGGCVATARPTTHDRPVYIKHGVVHYCVTNMPGAVPRTSTYALNNATLPHILDLADKGWHRAVADNPHLLAGVNVADGHLTCLQAAKSLGMKYRDSATLLAA